MPAKAIQTLRNTLKTHGRLEEAHAHFEQALAIFRESGDRCGQGVL